MVTQHAPTLGRPPRAHGKLLGAAVAGIGLTVILAVALLVWQSGREADQPVPLEPDTPVAAPGHGPATAGSAQESVTVYLVPSAEEAAALEREVRVFLSRHESVETDGSILALPAGTAEERTRVGVMVRNLRLELGDDRVHVVDLRLAPAAPDRYLRTCADGGAGDPGVVRDTCQ